MKITQLRTKESYAFSVGKSLCLKMPHLILISDLALISNFYMLIGEKANTLAFALALCALSISAAALCVLGSILELCVFLGILLFLILQHIVFAYKFGTEINFNTIVQYYGPLTFIVYYGFIKFEKTSKILELFYVYSLIYCSIFLVLSLSFYLGYIPREFEYNLFVYDEARGFRLLIATGTATYALIYALFNLRQKLELSRLLAFSLVFAVFYVSVSRLLILITISVLILSMLMNRRYISALCFIGFVCVSLVMFYGLFDNWFNPYEIFSGDTSGRIRADEYRDAIEIILDNPLLGAGIAGSNSQLAQLTQNANFAPMDLGGLGIWFVFGIVGLSFYILSTLLTCFVADFLVDSNEIQRKILGLIGCVVGMTGCLTPAIWYNGSLFGLIVAIFLAKILKLHQTVG